MEDRIRILPREDCPVWVVRSRCGRDRKRVFLAFSPAEKPDGQKCIEFPSMYTVNGGLHRVESPKKKHIVHLDFLGALDESEKNTLFTDYSNKTVAILVQKYDTYGELSKKREKTEESY